MLIHRIDKGKTIWKVPKLFWLWRARLLFLPPLSYAQIAACHGQLTMRITAGCGIMTWYFVRVVKHYSMLANWKKVKSIFLFLLWGTIKCTGCWRFKIYNLIEWTIYLAPGWCILVRKLPFRNASFFIPSIGYSDSSLAFMTSYP